MSIFTLLFKTETDNDIIEFFRDGSIDYDFWGKLDIYVRGKSFFDNFHSTYYGEDNDKTICFTNSSISKDGVTFPIFPLLNSILDASRILESEKQACFEDYTGQVGKKVIFELNINKVYFAIFQDSYKHKREDLWYDGRRLLLSKDLPKTNYNVISREDFLNGCTRSVYMYLENLKLKYPTIEEFLEFRSLFKKCYQ